MRRDRFFARSFPVPHLLRERLVPRSPETRAGRARWAAIGAAVAVVIGAGGAITGLASTSGAPSVFVPMTPCRLLDTRAGVSNVGPRATPLGAGETHITSGRGTVGACTIPGTATAVSLNVAIIDPTKPSYLTVFPGDASRPTSANLNWVAGQDPTPNAVTSGLGADGTLAFFNLAGTVELSVDVVGYYLPADNLAPDISSDLGALNSSVSSLQAKVDNTIAPTVTSLQAQVTNTVIPTLTSLQTQVSTLATPNEVVVALNNVTGSPTAAQSFTIATLTTTTAGRWALSAVWPVQVDCTSGSNGLVFLMVDNVPIVSTAVWASLGSQNRVPLVGTTPSSIAAGSHTVKVGGSCHAGSMSGMGVGIGGVVNVTVLR